MLLLKNTMELVYSFLMHHLRAQKSQMTARFGKKIVSDTKSIDVLFLLVI